MLNWIFIYRLPLHTQYFWICKTLSKTWSACTIIFFWILICCFQLVDTFPQFKKKSFRKCRAAAHHFLKEFGENLSIIQNCRMRAILLCSLYKSSAKFTCFDFQQLRTHLFKGTLAWDFLFRFLYRSNIQYIGQIIRLLSVSIFVLEFADLFDFINIRLWLSWRRVSFPVNWVYANWDSTLPESMGSEIPCKLSQNGIMKSS